jgi:outer membrane protein OmpA-like peptidoglycan-associated protein
MFTMRIKSARLLAISVLIAFGSSAFSLSFAATKEEKRKEEEQALQERFKWWPTDAQPGPVKDAECGGYWWWPDNPGKVSPLWGNRGYCYVRKIIFDYKEEELAKPKPQEPRPSLLIKKIIKNVKIYFDYDKAKLREDAIPILEEAIKSLNKNLEADILITGNCDIRGSEKYNEKLGRRRGEAVKKFMLDNGIAQERIKIVSRGKLDALAPITDLVGMQRDRNAQFMVAEVEEVMIPYPGKAQVPAPEAKALGEGKYVEEKQESLEGAIKVATKEYVVKKGDTLSSIAAREYGKPHRWKYLYQLNKDKIKNPNKLKVGQKIVIPVE